jgi:hypothetical protein
MVPVLKHFEYPPVLSIETLPSGYNSPEGVDAMIILIFNCGSSSQGFKVYDVGKNSTSTVIAAGKAKNVATQTQARSMIDWNVNGKAGSKTYDLQSCAVVCSF